MRIRTGRVGARGRRALLLCLGPLAALAVGSACSKPAPAPVATTEAPAASADAAPTVELGTSAQIDSGNTAYKAKDYKGALGHYRVATQRQPSLAAAWFGVYMAESALGNAAAADSAMKRVQAIAPGTMGAHPATASTSPGTLPPGHPAAGAPNAAGNGAGALPPGHPTLPGAPRR